MSDDELLIEHPTDRVLLLRLNRPRRRNALTVSLVKSLAARLAAAASDDAVGVVIVAGDEKAFSAGADIHEMVERGIDAILDDARLAAWRSIGTFPKPLIAAVRGVAFGAGNELVMQADLVVAGEGARFGQPEVRIGGLAGDGGTQRLPRLIGRQRATRMLLTGEPVTAAQALDMGLACEVVPDAEVDAAAVALGVRIARHAPLSLAATKALISATDRCGLEEGLRIEREALLRVFRSEDRVEGMRAFADKRSPSWSNR